MIAARGIGLAATPLALVSAFAMTGTGVQADGDGAARSIAAFAAHCFNPFLTAQRAAEAFGDTGARIEFYDLDPFSNAAPSPVTGRQVSEGTDRRCEVAFDGDHAESAAHAAVEALASEGILTDAALPEGHASQPGTTLLGARQLNPSRVAVVHVGTRPGPNGVETFMNVERRLPSTD